ncbi:hypothetical protein HOY80DRAFT_939589 [Tuber brumale]|nr:hypothetical protein HOY80DRAFT_939589 [Tuber brumale]
MLDKLWNAEIGVACRLGINYSLLLSLAFRRISLLLWFLGTGVSLLFLLVVFGSKIVLHYLSERPILSYHLMTHLN